MLEYKNILIVLLFVISGFFMCCCGNDGTNTVEMGSSTEDSSSFVYIDSKASNKCRAVVESFDSDEIYTFKGNLIVVGNEPFTSLVLKSPLDKDIREKILDDLKDTDKDKDIKLPEYIQYRIVDECSKELWDLQNINIKIKGKVERSYLEALNGKKIINFVLYPIEVQKVLKQDIEQ